MMAQRAQELLAQMVDNPRARYRAGQLECIRACVERRSRILLVQRTGWGKSIVYFVATKLLREAGAGPTLLISPLLSLMRNQVEMAGRIGVRALNFDSTNIEQWDEVGARLARDECDVLLISPERLGNESFVTRVLPAIPKGIGLFVVDEAHCISDWGHDFRPNYRRIRDYVLRTPHTVPILATTATANDRVVQDVAEQLGQDVQVVRGSLMRESLHLQTIELPSHADRLAWLAREVDKFPGSGIIYCLTKRDCELVADWLRQNGVAALAYHSSLVSERNENDAQRRQREELLQLNKVKALVATVALGMGYDKPDLGFVIHYQRPGSIVAYYQQIGRAGRAIDKAIVVLLHGAADDEITSYFIETAFPSAEIQRDILAVLAGSAEGLSNQELQRHINQSWRRIDHCLTHLEVLGVIHRVKGKYACVPHRPWRPDLERQQRVTALRYREMEMMREFCRHSGCFMEFIARQLDDPQATACGKCAHCAGDFVTREVDPALVLEAVRFLKRIDRVIEPRKFWPAKDATAWNMRKIDVSLAIEPGRALCLYLDPGWGQSVHDGKYRSGQFDEAVIEAARELIAERWRPDPPPGWVAAVPSRRRPTLVPEFARRLAECLGLPFHAALDKVTDTAEQKRMQNSAQQLSNLVGAFRVDPALVLVAPVLLVDDIVDSRWTLTYTGALLRQAGAPLVYPFALAMANSALD